MSDTIYFLHHSGFIYENETSLLVFDFYKDPEDRLETLLKDSTKKLYFFVSHYHADHFNRDIRRWEERAEAYIMHKNCWLTMDREEKKHLMVPGDTLTIGDLTVTMYGSTDEGGSFLVKCGGKTIFHAGDLNWWHWAGEPAADNLAARQNFFDNTAAVFGYILEYNMIAHEQRKTSFFKFSPQAAGNFPAVFRLHVIKTIIGLNHYALHQALLIL